MRTKNHFCVGEGPDGFLKALSGFYPAGRVAVLCRNLLEGQRVAAPLLRKYKVNLLSLEEKENRKEDVRFVVGVGGPEIADQTRAFAGDVPFAFYAGRADYRFLNAFDGTGRLSEFAYLDLSSARTDAGTIAVYSSLFCLWCECRLRLFEKSYLPFLDKELLAYCESMERVLSGKCDKEEFLSEALRLIALSSGRLKNEKGLYVMAATADLTPEKQFVGAYFTLAMTFNFTKIPFSDILYLSEEDACFEYDEEVLPDKEKMKSFARRMKAMTALPEVSPKEILSLLSSARSSDLPLLSRAAHRGLFEGSEYEKFTRDRRVFV